MASVRRNVIANFAGRGISAFVSLAFVPLYIRYLGIESYGLVGFFATLQSIVGVLDFGLSTTMTREMARCTANADEARDARNLVRTLETIYWPIGAAIGLLVAAGAPLIARHWLNAQSLPADVVTTAIMLIGLMIALQWPISFYEGGIIGLQRMVLYNMLHSAAMVVRGVGAIAVLHFVSPTITAFFVWQVVASGLTVLVVTVVLWRGLPSSPAAPRFSGATLRRVWQFAAGISVVALVSIALTQADKLVVSKALSLAAFGYYNVAASVAAALYHFVYPVATAIFPRFSALLAANDQSGLERDYHVAAQLMTVVIAPPALVVAFFSYDLVRLWTQSALTAQNTYLTVSLLIAGTMLNGFMHIPYSVQLAFGQTRLVLYNNLVALVVAVPLLFVATRRFGGPGAAAVWLLLNLSYFVISIPIFHRHYLVGQLGRWYGSDIGLPLIAALAVAAASRALTPADLGTVPLVLVLAATGACALAASAAAAPYARLELATRLAAMRGRPA